MHGGLRSRAINMRYSYPHWGTSFDYVETMIVASTPTLGTTRCYGDGMGHRSRLKSISIPSLNNGWVDRQPFFSLVLYLPTVHDKEPEEVSTNTTIIKPLWNHSILETTMPHPYANQILGCPLMRMGKSQHLVSGVKTR